MRIDIDGRQIGLDHPTYFIADIAANHDGSLDRAIELIHKAKQAGADAAKFQHFTAEKIVSDEGFTSLGRNLGHQARWKKSVSQVYRDASVPWEWTRVLKKECDQAGITFFSSPYDREAVDHLDGLVPAFKVGSGDIDWLEQLDYIASKQKPVILATGASTLTDVVRAVETLLGSGVTVALLQCNTNYTANESNYDYLDLRVLSTFRAIWPEIVVGLSDHTSSVAPVLGAVSLGARIIERHFTDDNSREGPDHAFALNPQLWRAMVDETRLLERALGSPFKKVARNELETSVIQRRCIRASHDLPPGHLITRQDLEVLRPAEPGALTPDLIPEVVGTRTLKAVSKGTALRFSDLAT
jgi:sialic acid synthase SpsE